MKRPYQGLTPIEYANFVADQAIELACATYLNKLGYTLWANWTINDEERRKLATAWLHAQLVGVLGELNANAVDADIKDWRDSWQRSLILQKSSAVLRRSRKLLVTLKQSALSAATHTSALWTAVRTYLRSSRPTDSSSEFLTWIASHAGTDEVNLPS